MVSGTVTIDLGPLRKYRTALEADFRLRANGPVRKGFKQWGARYRSFLRERFDKYSKGGGDWAPLSPKTIARRRKGRARTTVRGERDRRFKLGTVSILRDKGIMFAALDPVFRNKPGQLQDDIPFGIRVGFGGAAPHGDDKITVAYLALIHDQGLGHVPARVIVVAPDSATQRGMASDMERAHNQMVKDTNAGA